MSQFAQAIDWQPNLVSYYSAWGVPFKAGFAASAAKHSALTLVQIDPKNVSLAKIAAGRYDKYLRSYAAEVKAFRSQVVLSFGHEMNGNWYSWGNRHTSATVFVAPGVTWSPSGRRGHERDLAVDGQHRRQNSGCRCLTPGLVARQLVRELGRDRRLLLQVRLSLARSSGGPWWTCAS